MKLRRTLTICLLLFVVVSVGYFIYDEARLNMLAKRVSDTHEQGETDLLMPSDYSVLYYFHGTVRCKACLDMEKNAKETLETHFPSKVADGTLRWKEVNIDLPDNYNYVDQYLIMYNTLIIQKYEEDEPTRWKELHKAWDLAEREEQYIQYVREEVSAFVEGN
jgi:hypothetical protein